MTQSIDGYVTRTDNGCQVQDGFYVKRGAEFKWDALATAYGACQWMVYGCSPPPCGCKPWNSPTMPQLRTINHIQMWQNKDGIDDVYPKKTWGKDPVTGVTKFYQELDSRNLTLSTGGWPWSPTESGDYTIKFQGVINVTNCNLLPDRTPLRAIPVYVRCALHKGSPWGGWLDGGQELESGSGYYHYHGSDPPHQDAWGGCESTIATIETVGMAFLASYGARMGVGDISKQDGGAFPPHSWHQNGLDIDLRYVRDNYAEQGLDVLTSPDSYNRAATLELLRMWAATGKVAEIIVDPAANIAPADVPGVTITVDNEGDRIHRNHFHVRLNDPDGSDSNNC